ncbi:MAG: SDR family NAD(P)-dependent oxidoreductase [Rhodospirillaceae bacterium]|nr:SDR family NAD(P)-dependent oxidoreductase [Rhodospirillaceae bacterium]
MTAPLQKPKRKNPILRTRLPTLPPAARSRVTLGMLWGASQGRFELQVCRDCGAVQYPPREVCRRCLSDRLDWKEQPEEGELISETLIRHSLELYFRERTPWRAGMVRLPSGVSVIAHLHGDVPRPPAKVRVRAMLDRAGQAVLVALPEQDTPNMADDKMLREMTCDPKFRKVLVTDGKTAVGQALVKALVKAGADLVWVGNAEPWKNFPGFDEIKALPKVTILPLDVTDQRSVREIGGEIAGRVDIVINNSEVHRTYGISGRYGTDAARSEMDVNYFGLLRLAQEFGPALKGRGADGVNSAVAWVNLLSIYALSNFPPHGTFSASKAAAHSLAQCLRAEMRPFGVRVINVYPGPIDDEWNQLLLPPKIAPAALANAIVDALKQGIEDSYPGDVAKDWLARWRDNPKALEQEAANP